MEGRGLGGLLMGERGRRLVSRDFESGGYSCLRS